MNDEIKRLKEEAEYYKGLCETLTNMNNLQNDTIRKYHEVTMVLEAENEELRKRVRDSNA